MSLHHAIAWPKSKSAIRFVSSIYDICVFGNGTVNETHQKLVRAKLMPSYIQAKWIHFNKFGLNRVKVENAVIMFFANSTTLALDLALLPITAQTGYAEVQVLPIFIDTSKLLVVRIAQWQLQEYFERKFNHDMFDGKRPKFLVKIKEIESFIVQKHEINFTLHDDYIVILQKFTKLPMLNFIFFYSQMTDEYILYRSKFKKIENIFFKNIDDATNFFKTAFRMLRFYYYIEIHALNYFFNSSFGKILNFYSDINHIKRKFASVFYHNKDPVLLSDLTFFLKYLKEKMQTQIQRNNIDHDYALLEQFQNVYFQFFFDAENIEKKIFNLFDSHDVQKNMREIYNDELKVQQFFALAKNYIASNIKTLSVFQTPQKKAGDLFSLILKNLTNRSGHQYSNEMIAIASISGVIGVVAVVAGTAIAVQNKSKILNVLEDCYRKVYRPISNFFQHCEQQISDIFGLDATVLNSQANRILGSTVFLVSHMVSTPFMSTVSGILAKISYFNPIHAYILRSAEKFTRERLEKIDLDVLHRVDKYFRLGYKKCGAIVIKFLNVHQQWTEDFDVDAISDDFLVFMTHNFARVVRHQSQTMGSLFGKITNLDREIESFQIDRYQDLLYCTRDENGPVFLDQMCRITASIGSDLVESRSKMRFFDILIERQNTLSELIHHSYYVMLYLLFMQKIKRKCHDIFNSHLEYAFKQLDVFFANAA